MRMEESLAKINSKGKIRGTYSNEALQAFALAGNKDALEKLYLQVRGLWLGSVPFDATMKRNWDDWVQIAAEEFSSSWMKYDKDRGRFSTFISTCIQFRWRNELSMEQTASRKGEVVRDCIESGSLENILYSEFAFYSDEGYMDFYIERFKLYISSEVYILNEVKREDFFKVLKTQLSFEGTSLTQLASAVGRPKKIVEACLRLIRIHALKFASIERRIKYGPAICG